MSTLPVDRSSGTHSSLGTRDALVLVACGGALGTFARWLLAAVLGNTEGLSAGVVMANLIGAGALGYLTSRLRTAALTRSRAERLTLFLGVGVLGGFTTYSTLAVHGALLLDDGSWWTAAWHVLAHVFLGLAAAVLGLVAGAGREPRWADGERRA